MQPSWSALKRKDLRQHHRYAVENTFLRVAWLDTSGALKMAHDARVLNISEGGMAIELPEAAQLLSRLKIQSDKHHLLGQGAVRHCRRIGTRYVVGIEFTDGLRWQPPDGDITEPIPLSGVGK